MRLIIVLTAIAILLTSCDFKSQEKIEPSTEPELNFYISNKCKFLDNAYGPNIDGQWWDGEVFSVRVNVSSYCEGVDIKGDYKLDGNDLELIYKIEKVGQVSECLCTHEVSYEFTGLNPGDYRTSLTEDKGGVYLNEELGVVINIPDEWKDLEIREDFADNVVKFGIPAMVDFGKDSELEIWQDFFEIRVLEKNEEVSSNLQVVAVDKEGKSYVYFSPDTIDIDESSKDYGFAQKIRNLDNLGLMKKSLEIINNE